MIRSLAILASGAAALVLAASAAAAPAVHVNIRHQVRGCHAWAVGNGPYKAAQTLTVKAGTTLTVSNFDVMPHRLVELSGRKLTLHGAEMAKMGAQTSFTLTKPGTYKFTTKAGEDYTSGVKTIGEDNVLTLTVVVS